MLPTPNALPTHTGVDIHSPFPMDLLVLEKQEIDSHSFFTPDTHQFSKIYIKRKSQSFHVYVCFCTTLFCLFI